MTEIAKRTIDVSQNLSITTYERIDPRSGSYLSIRNNSPKTEGEILINPSDIPSLVKALTEAYFEITSTSSWYTGYDKGFRAALK